MKKERVRSAGDPDLHCVEGPLGSCLTSSYLHLMRVPHYVVVEHAESKRYQAALGPLASPLVLDPAYRRDYDTFDALGDTKSKGATSRGITPSAWAHAGTG